MSWVLKDALILLLFGIVDLRTIEKGHQLVAEGNKMIGEGWAIFWRRRWQGRDGGAAAITEKCEEERDACDTGEGGGEDGGEGRWGRWWRWSQREGHDNYTGEGGGPRIPDYNPGLRRRGEGSL